MSTWINIDKLEDVEYDHIENTVDIFIGNDDFGNNYVTIPVELIIATLRTWGYEIKDT